MLAMLCGGAIALGILTGWRSSFLILLLVSPIVWVSSALALSAVGGTVWFACIAALGPVVALQIAYFAGVQIHLEAADARRSNYDRARLERPSRWSARLRRPSLRPLEANDRNEKAERS